MLADTFYWDMDDGTRAFAKRFYDKLHKMPNGLQAGAYSATMHYLQAVDAAGTTDGDAVMAKMKAMPIHDFFAANGVIRAGWADGARHVSVPGEDAGRVEGRLGSV